MPDKRLAEFFQIPYGDWLSGRISGAAIRSSQGSHPSLVTRASYSHPWSRDFEQRDIEVDQYDEYHQADT